MQRSKICGRNADGGKKNTCFDICDGFLCFLCGVEKDTPIDTLPLKEGAENYLREGGLSEKEIAQIEAYLTGDDAENK